MKKTYIALAVAMMITGCGGGSNTDITTQPSSPTNPTQVLPNNQTQIVTDHEFFDKTPITIPNFKQYFDPENVACIRSVQPTVTAVDLNGDNKKDLVFHVWCGLTPEEWGTHQTKPTSDTLMVFLQDENGKFVFANQEVFGSALIKLGSASRKVVVQDFNNDGYMDIAYAMNREDGRTSIVDVTTLYANIVVLLSKGKGKYSIDKVGNPGWFHAIDAVKNNQGSYDLVFAGFHTSPQAFKYANGWQEITEFYPRVSAGTFKGTSDGKTIITNLSNPASLDKFDLVQGKWVKTALSKVEGVYLTTEEYPGTVGLSYSRVVGDMVHVGAGYAESCYLKLHPTQTVFIGKYSFAGISKDKLNSGENINPTTASFQGYRMLHGYSLVNLERINSFIENEVITANYNYFSCEDVNNDGYEDIVVHVLNSSDEGLIVYLNDKNGKLVKLNQNSLIKAPSEFFNYTTLFVDLNNDGVRDILMWSISNNSLDAHIYKGKAHLTLR